jgi:hypothetical protein
MKMAAHRRRQAGAAAPETRWRLGERTANSLALGMRGGYRSRPRPDLPVAAPAEAIARGRAGQGAAVPVGAYSSAVEVATEWVLQICCRPVVVASRAVARRHGDVWLPSVMVCKVDSGDRKLLGTLRFGLDGVGCRWWSAYWKRW